MSIDQVLVVEQAQLFQAGQARAYIQRVLFHAEKYKPNAFLKRWRMLKNPGTAFRQPSGGHFFETVQPTIWGTNVNSATSFWSALHNRDMGFALTGYSETCTTGYWNGISSGMVGDERWLQGFAYHIDVDGGVYPCCSCQFDTTGWILIKTRKIRSLHKVPKYFINAWNAGW